jgi:hypothetical protein
MRLIPVIRLGLYRNARSYRTKRKENSSCFDRQLFTVDKLYRNVLSTANATVRPACHKSAGYTLRGARALAELNCQPIISAALCSYFKRVDSFQKTFKGS